MSQLHIYTVHVNPSLPEPYERAEFAEEGFNWKAFFFTFLWCFYQRLFVTGGLILAFNGLIYYLMDQHCLTPVGYLILHGSVHLLAGFSGNDWLRERFRRKGYIIADLVTGTSLLAAELRFFDRYFASRNAPAFAG